MKFLIILLVLIIYFLVFIKSENFNIKEHKSVRSIFKDVLLKKSLKNVERYDNSRGTTTTNTGGSGVNELNVGIVGAGMAGLYSAMILQDLGINYTIFEANKERIGGRVYTHRFSDKDDDNNNEYLYVDLGAMRFPNITIMDRVINTNKNYSLFTKLKEAGYPVPTIPYYLSANNNIKYFNGKRIYKNLLNQFQLVGDPFHFSDSKNGGNGSGVPDQYAFRDYNSLMDDVIGRFVEKLENDFDDGIKTLLEADDYSVKQYLKQYGPYPNSVINYIETMECDTSFTGLSFTETVINSLDFSGAEWICIDGGTDFLVKSMEKILKNKVKMGKEVCKISKVSNGNGKLYLEFINETSTNNQFKHIISTTTLPALQRIDTSGLNLPLKTKQAILQLSYDESVKIAIHFKYRWWEDSKIMKGRPIFGGSSTTDLPIRTIVYPSGGVHNKNASGILLASYVWAQDAARLSSLIGDKEKEEKLIELCLKNLAEIHNVDLNLLKNLYVDYKCQNWAGDTYASGAYAYFFPTQFVDLFPSITIPLSDDNNFHIAGEHSSLHHSWIIGALSSAYRAVDHILLQEGLFDLRTKFIQNWGTIEECEDPLSPLNSDYNENYDDRIAKLNILNLLKK